MQAHKIVKACPQTDTCLGCRDDGVGTRAYLTEDGYVVGIIHTKECHQGFPGLIHGGMIGLYFDEVFWHLYELVDPAMIAMTLRTEISYLKPVPTDTKIMVVGRVSEVNGRKFIAKGQLLLPDGQKAAECEILYLGIRKGAVEDLEEKEVEREKTYFQQSDLGSVCF